MEHGERNLPLDHAVHKGEHRFLIVVRREGGGEPEAVGPGGQLRGTAREGGVCREDVLRRLAGTHKVFHRLAGHGKLRLGGGFAANLIGHAPGGIDKHAVAAAAEEERHVLVSLLAVGAAVRVPQVDALAVLHEGAEALAQAVDVFSHGELEPLAQIRLPRAPVEDMGHALWAGRCEQPAAEPVFDAPVLPRDHARFQITAAQEPEALLPACLRLLGAAAEREARHGVERAAVVHQMHGDRVAPPGGYPNREQAAVERVAAVLHGHIGAIEREAFCVRRDFVDLTRRLHREAVLRHPHAVRKFHESSSFGQPRFRRPVFLVLRYERTDRLSREK